MKSIPFWWKLCESFLSSFVGTPAWIAQSFQQSLLGNHVGCSQFGPLISSWRALGGIWCFIYKSPWTSYALYSCIYIYNLTFKSAFRYMKCPLYWITYTHTNRWGQTYMTKKTWKCIQTGYGIISVAVYHTHSIP